MKKLTCIDLLNKFNMLNLTLNFYYKSKRKVIFLIEITIFSKNDILYNDRQIKILLNSLIVFDNRYNVVFDFVLLTFYF